MKKLLIILKAVVSLLSLLFGQSKSRQASKILKLKEQVDAITETIDSLEKLPRNYSRSNRLYRLYTARVRLNRRIRRLQNRK